MAFCQAREGPLFASASWDSTVKIWDCQNDRIHSINTLSHHGYVYDVRWNTHRAHTLASSCEDGTVTIWDIRISSPAKVNLMFVWLLCPNNLTQLWVINHQRTFVYLTIYIFNCLIIPRFCVVYRWSKFINESCISTDFFFFLLLLLDHTCTSSRIPLLRLE